MTAPLLEFDRVAIHLGGREILSPTSFEVGRGEFVCIVGPSGCGKTTLLRAASGLVAPSGGTVRRNGQPVTQPSREVAFVFQDYGRALLPWRTVQGNVSLALEAAGVPKAERAARITGVLAKVSLSAHAHKFPAQLSGGMQQRAQIARCLAQAPQLLLMDEPFGALDALTRRTLQDELIRIWTEFKKTICFVTHGIEESIYLSDRIVVMTYRPGTVKAIVPIELPRPRHTTTPEFNELKNMLGQMVMEEQSRHQKAELAGTTAD